MANEGGAEVGGERLLALQSGAFIVGKATKLENKTGGRCEGGARVVVFIHNIPVRGLV